MIGRHRAKRGGVGVERKGETDAGRHPVERKKGNRRKARRRAGRMKAGQKRGAIAGTRSAENIVIEGSPSSSTVRPDR